MITLLRLPVNNSISSGYLLPFSLSQSHPLKTGRRITQHADDKVLATRNVTQMCVWPPCTSVHLYNESVDGPYFLLTSPVVTSAS